MKPHLSIRQLIRLSLAVGLLAAGLAPVPAQAQEPPKSQGLWQTFTTANSGLRNNQVTALLEDRAGGLWIGTSDGVSRYFEGTWQAFSAESGNLGDNWVTALLEDRAGGVWVGTNGGVSHYFQGAWQTFSTEGGRPGYNRVTTLLEDQAGGVWVGTFEGGVSRYLQGTWQTFSTESGSLSDNWVTALLEDRAGGVWVGTNGGVSRYFEGIWQTLSTETGSLGDDRVTTLLEDQVGRLWVGTDGGGVSRYSQGAWQTFSVESGSLGNSRVAELLEDQAGGVWVGTLNGGVSRYFQGTWQTFSTGTGSLGINLVTELLEDRASRLWVGTLGGVSHYFQGIWRTFSVETGSLGDNDVIALLEDRAGGVWVGTQWGGVSRHFEGTWQAFSTKSESLGSNYVTTLLADRAGGVWVGTNGGVSRYFQGTWQTFSVESDSLGDNWVTALLEDQFGGMWVGTYGGGMSHYFEGTWQTFSVETGSLSSNFVNALLEDRAGGVWVGTRDGVSRYFEGTWQTFSLRGNEVTILLEDRAGGVWFGTYGGGVSHYFQGVWQTFSVETGSLGSNYVTALLEDQVGGLWVGTRGGVSRYFESAWQTFSIETGSLSDNYVTALLEDRASRMWVGTSGGVSYHRPGSNRPWVLLHQLEVEREGRIQRYDLSSGDVSEVALDFPVERLAIRFVGADLDSHPDNIRYFYQLEGWDTARRPTAEGVAQYENLPPGRYTFVVQSLDENLTFSPEARLAIVIPAPFWRTGWFWEGVALLAVGAVVGTVIGGRRWRRARRLADWRAGHDPYIVGDVVEEPDKFYGREEALADLLRALEAGNHVALYGERRIGKTSLLHQLAHRLREMANRPGAYLYLPVFVNLQMVREARFFYALMRTIAGVARPYLNERGQTLPSLLADERSEGYDSLDMADDLEEVLESLHEVTDRPVRIVLLLDEADKMNSYDPHTQEGLRGLLMTPLGRQVKLVWSGQTMNRQWRLETSPWFNLFKHEIHLAGLEEEAAVRLIRQPVKGVFTYDDEAVARILLYSDGKPYTIQRLCSFCIRQLLTEDRFRVTVEDVETAYQAMQDEDARRAAEEVASQAIYAPRAPIQSLAEGRGEYQADEPHPEEEEEGEEE